MISFFRQALGSKIAMAILAIIVLAFILTGVATRELPGASSLTGPSGGGVITVGDRSISSTELEGRVRSQFAQYAQQQPGLNIPAFIMGGGFDAIVNQTIGATALEAFGRSLGLTASKRQVDGEIAGIGAFHGPDGKFDQQTYLAALAQQHLTDQQVRSDLSGDIVRRAIYLPASGAVKLSDGLIAPYASLLIEQRHGTIGLVPLSAFSGGPAPTDAELQAFYKTHLAAYAVPERRVLRYALIGRDQVASAATPSEADIRKVYDTSAAKYAARETRTLSQVVLDRQAKAAAFKASVATGKSFVDAAKAAGFGAADIAIGTKSQADFAQLASPQVAAAAFAAPMGAVSEPVKDDFGWHVVKVDAIQKIAETPYEKARPDIAADLIKQNQDKALGDLLAKLQDAIDNGQNFADAVQKNGLAVTETPPVTMSGSAPDQPDYKAPPELAPLLKSGFQGSSDSPPTVETIQQGERYALLTLGRIVPAAPIPFAQAKPRLVGDFSTVRAGERAKAVATALVAKVRAGISMADAFKAAPVALAAPQPAAGRRVDLSRFQGHVPAALATLFTTPVGQVKLAPGEAGQGWFVVRTDSIEPADPKSLPMMIGSSRDDLTQAASNEYLEQLAHAAEHQIGVKRDNKAIDALKQRLMGGAPAGE